MEAAIVLALAACVSSDPEARGDHVEALEARHAEAAAELLEDQGPLTLERCIELALTRNLQVRGAELSARLAEIDTSIAFSSFLPRIDASFQYQGQSETPLRQMDGNTFQLADQRIAEFSIAAQQPIFTPQAWLLYGARQKGEDVSQLVLDRTRQLIQLEVTARYYACLAREAQVHSQQQALREAGELEREARARRLEGLLTQAQLEEVELLQLSRDAELASTRRALLRERAGLLEVLDLPPLFDVTLAEPEAGPAWPEGDLADLVTQALFDRPEMHVADRRVDIRRDEVRIALAGFLPEIYASGGYLWSSDSFLVNPAFWTGGLGAVLNLFDGFRTLEEHRAASVREDAELLERERVALAVILEVVEAHRQAEDIAASQALAARRLAVAEQRFERIEARWGEGMAQESERLRAIADRDRARAGLQVVGYQERVALATLRDVTGLVETEEADDETTR